MCHAHRELFLGGEHYAVTRENSDRGARVRDGLHRVLYLVQPALRREDRDVAVVAGGRSPGHLFRPGVALCTQTFSLSVARARHRACAEKRGAAPTQFSL